MATRERPAGIPIWVKVPGIITLVLIGVVVTAMLAGNLGTGGGPGQERHEPSDEDTPSADVSDPDGGGHRPPGGGHG